MEELITDRMAEMAEEHDIDIGSLSLQEMDDLWDKAERSVVDQIADEGDRLWKERKENL
ncbi:MAG: hypothetical protein U9Q97_08375 [Acidobacteriota bacterium]|nr:hypothetical protein [Acidobacteriota bacterium]